MIGEYARLTPAELERAVEDPRWALDFIEELIDVGMDETGGSQSRCLDIGKAWDTLALMLRRIDFPVDILVPFFEAAARDGDAMAVWLD